MKECTCPTEERIVTDEGIFCPCGNNEQEEADWVQNPDGIEFRPAYVGGMRDRIYDRKYKEYCTGLAWQNYPEKYKDRFIRERWIGIKDANDKNIYEGDIINRTDYQGKPYIVKWEPKHVGHATALMYGYVIPDLYDDKGNYVKVEVIGNIHEG